MKLETLSKIAYGSFFAGAVVGLGGAYHLLTQPSTYPNLDKYYKIKKKPDNFPRSITLENLESNTTELLAYIDKLKNERNKRTQNSDFTKIQKDYKFKPSKRQEAGASFMIGGLGLISLSLIPLVSSRRLLKKENNREAEDYEVTL